MKKIVLISLLLVLILVFAFFSCQTKAPSSAPEKSIAAKLVLQVDSFAAACSRLEAAAEGGPDEKSLQELFLRARLSYKQFEWAAEFFEPATSRFVNGPPVQEVEPSGQVIEPAGLQVMETFLFPHYDSARKKDLIQQCRLMQVACTKYKGHFTNIDILNWQVFDASKQEVFRLETTGIAGFDDPLTLKSMTESAAALKSLREVLAYYTKEDTIRARLDAAVAYLNENTDFNAFNRAEFIRSYANPLTTAISNLREELKMNTIRYNSLLNQDARTLFDSNAYNVNAYVPDLNDFISDEKVALGKMLFSDPSLSGTGTRSCRSCHQPEKAFTDGLVKNTTIDNNDRIKRNTPTLINAALQPSQFFDLRVRTLEDQSLNVVQNKAEMHGSMQLSVNRLWQDSVYRRLFSKAFPKKDRNGIDTLEVMNAIGSYVRSLVMLNSRFDEYMRGNSNAMNAGEINGFNLFMGKAKCATCHYMPLFNGTFPPRYMKTEAEVIGVPATATGKEIDSDLGRYAIVKVESLKHAFKTPTVRNAARTAPYMHNGVFTTLEQVIDFYNKGGGVGLGMKIDNQTLPFDKLDLSRKEQSDIIAFIKALDSR